MGVVVSTIDYSRPHSIQVPDSDIGYHFGSLLDNQEGVDVILNVGGERFHAHMLVLAARSHVFRSQFFDDESEGEKNEVDESDELREFSIDDMEPKVFKVCCCSHVNLSLQYNSDQQVITLCEYLLQAMLHFIYRDTLVDDNELGASSSDGSVFDSLAAKLLAAADKYDLGRLRLLCESYLCKGISVASVASTLALADRHHAMELKAVCLKFAAENLSGTKTFHIESCF